MNDIYQQCESRAKLDDYLADFEVEYLQNNKRVPEFLPGEVAEMLKDDDESSFNDDGVPPSEEEFFSTDWEENDVDDYLPPITRRKRVLIHRLLMNEHKPSDPGEIIEARQAERDSAIKEFRGYILKKRAIKAYKRLLKLKDANITNSEQAAFFLEKLELKDKKLIRPFYYEASEPACYKKLLKKRKKAVKRKYEMYAMSPEYRTDLKLRTYACIQNIVAKANITKPSIKAAQLLNEAVTLHNEMDAQIDELKEQLETTPQHKGDSCWPFESDVSVSSFLDDEICDSEKSFFSSPFEEDDLPHPQPNSRRLRKYHRLINKCHPMKFDDEDEQRRKLLKRAEIEADFKNYIEWRRATKAMSRYKVVQNAAIKGDLITEAECLLHTEILDKQLDRDFYYSRDEPECYKVLLGKRRRAIIRKHEKYVEDPKFRQDYETRIFANYLRIQESKYFGDITSSEDEETSSFNDTEIPTSEMEFMSQDEIGLPHVYDKPLTRNKAALYDVLQDLEVDPLLDLPEELYKKRKMRLRFIQDFKNTLRERRRMKAAKRLKFVQEMGLKDPASRAIKLKRLEEKDKHLNRGFYYRPDEPEGFKDLLEMRLKAIERKYTKYYRDPEFREEYEKRIEEQATAGIAEADEAQPEEWSMEEQSWIAEADDPDQALDDHILRSDLDMSIRDTSIYYKPIDSKELLIRKIHDYSIEGGSLLEKGHRKEKMREFAKRGIWPPRRLSGPPRLDRVHDFSRLSLLYDEDDNFNREYQKHCWGFPSQFD